MTSKHTPGPWKHVGVGEHNRIVGPHGDSLFLVGMYGQFGRSGPLPNRATHIASIVEEEANASLIAAAPDLLEALKSMVNYANLGAYERADAMKAARAAITKAKGD